MTGRFIRPGAWTILFAPLAMFLAGTARAGPPYVTDDPEPVPLHHWELYLASKLATTPDGTSGTAPHVEVNYGAAPELHLHLILPLAFAKANGRPLGFGLGDIELGAKYRFVDEDPWRPQVGTFPLVEVPTGSAAQGLGAGATQLFVPLWRQKSWGPWTTYGGAGRWFTLGDGHAQWWLAGALVQRQLGHGIALGVEGYYEGPPTGAGSGAFSFDVGMVWDLTEHHHLLLSAARAFGPEVAFQDYVAYQLTLQEGKPMPVQVRRSPRERGLASMATVAGSSLPTCATGRACGTPRRPLARGAALRERLQLRALRAAGARLLNSVEALRHDAAPPKRHLYEGRLGCKRGSQR